MADVQSNIKVSIDTTDALASIKNLQRQISAFHTSMAKGGAAANAVTAQMQQTLINSLNATGKFSAQIKTIKTTTESFTSSLEKLRCAHSLTILSCVILKTSNILAMDCHSISLFLEYRFMLC